MDEQQRGRNRRLKILFATARYLPESGGTEIHTHEVAQRLAARGAEVTVVSTAIRGSFARESWDGPVKVTRVRAWPPNRDYYLAPALVRVIRENRTDLIHCQGYHTLVAPVVMLAALSARIPYVVTLHSGGHSSAVRRLLRPLQAWILRPLLVRARHLIAVSDYEADLFARRLRLSRTAFVVIPSGVDLPTVSSRTAKSATPLVLSIGRLERYKGHHRVIAALPAINRVRPGTRLRIVGAGPYEGKLHAVVARLGVGDLVEIAAVPAEHRDEMADLLQQAHVVTMLSRYESQGLAIQEALALGRPLLISDTAALSELTRYPNVVAVSRRAGPDEIAAAVLGLLDAPAEPPPKLPTWDECAAALYELYQETLATDE
jgi:glycosyltransferase involved in cell wall biosynthesis